MAGFDKANILVTLKGYDDDLLQAVSAGASSPNFHVACLPGISKFCINPVATGSNKFPDASTGRYFLISTLPYLPGCVAISFHKTSFPAVYGAIPYVASHVLGFSLYPKISQGLVCGESVP